MTLSRKATTTESVYSNDKRPPRWPVRGNEEAGKLGSSRTRARKTIVPCAPKWEDVSPTSTLPRELDSCLIGLKTFYAAATNLRLTIGIKNVGTDNGSMDAQMQLGVRPRCSLSLFLWTVYFDLPEENEKDAARLVSRTANAVAGSKRSSCVFVFFFFFSF